jgi:hypothetical protein
VLQSFAANLGPSSQTFVPYSWKFNILRDHSIQKSLSTFHLNSFHTLHLPWVVTLDQIQNRSTSKTSNTSTLDPSLLIQLFWDVIWAPFSLSVAHYSMHSSLTSSSSQEPTQHHPDQLLPAPSISIGSKYLPYDFPTMTQANQSLTFPWPHQHIYSCRTKSHGMCPGHAMLQMSPISFQQPLQFLLPTALLPFPSYADPACPQELSHFG